MCLEVVKGNKEFADFGRSSKFSLLIMNSFSIVCIFLDSSPIIFTFITSFDSQHIFAQHTQSKTTTMMSIASVVLLLLLLLFVLTEISVFAFPMMEWTAVEAVRPHKGFGQCGRERKCPPDYDCRRPKK